GGTSADHRATMKKAPHRGAFKFAIVSRSGGGLYAGGLGPLRSLRDFVADALAFLQGAEALGSNGRIVHEHVGAAVLGGDEAEPLGVVEPLHGAVLHSDADLVLDGMRARVAPRRTARVCKRPAPPCNHPASNAASRRETPAVAAA